jgi:hypothetical protein
MNTSADDSEANKPPSADPSSADPTSTAHPHPDSNPQRPDSGPPRPVDSAPPRPHPDSQQPDSDPQHPDSTTPPPSNSAAPPPPGGARSGLLNEPTTLTKGLPVWVVRTTVALAIVAIGVLLAVQGVSGVLLGILALLGALCVLVPASPAPAMVIIATAVSAAMVVDDPLTVGVLVLLPLVHLVHIGSAVAAVIPGTARVHLSALRPTMIRFGVVQVLTLGLAGVAAIVPTATTPTVFEAAGLVGAAVLALIAARLILKRPL